MRFFEISDERLQDYLSRAGKKVDSRMSRMAQARDRLNKGYEIYHAEKPTRIVHRFDANTPAEAKRYYELYNANYESDVDYDLRLRRATGIMSEDLVDYEGLKIKLSKDADGVAVKALASNGSKELGNAEFFFDEQGRLDPQTVWVDERYYGQGIAKVMYNYLRDKGYKIIRSWDQTPAGKGFWDKHQGADATVWENMDHSKDGRAVEELKAALVSRKEKLQDASDDQVYDIIDKIMTRIAKSHSISGQQLHDMWVDKYKEIPDTWIMNENFADGKKPGRKGLAKRSGVNCKQSVSKLRSVAANSTGEKQRMAHWCANMKAGRNNESLEEGWKEKVAALGLGAAALGGVAVDDYINGPATTQDVQHVMQVPAEIQKPQAPTSKPEKLDVKKSEIKNLPPEKLLATVAKASGIVGNELAQLLAQAAHETLNFTHMAEIGNTKYFSKKYDPKFAPKKAKALGNTQIGDGERYKGRGFLQITGRYNYAQAGKALGLPLEQNPELLERPDVAAKAAVWYWNNRVAPKVANFDTSKATTKAVTKAINPGMKHLKQRQEKLKQYKQDIKKI
jgi:putative chitinase